MGEGQVIGGQTPYGYEVGDTVVRKAAGTPRMPIEFLGVGYSDDTHYYRRDDGLIFGTFYPAEFEKYVPRPEKGERWKVIGMSPMVTRVVLDVSDEYVIYNARHDQSGNSYLHVKTLEEFMQGVRVE